jgi:hypothetical protein
MVFASGDSRWRHIDQRALQVVIMVLEAIIAHGWHAGRCSLPLVSVGVFTGLFVPLVPDPPWTTPVCLVVTFLGEAIELVTLPAIANAQVLLGWVTTHVACTRCTNGDLAYHAMDRGLVESTHSTPFLLLAAIMLATLALDSTATANSLDLVVLLRYV